MLDTWLMCSQLRPDDIEHYMAYSFLPEWDFEKAAADFWGRPGMKFCYQDHDGRPLAVLGLTPVTLLRHVDVQPAVDVGDLWHRPDPRPALAGRVRVRRVRGKAASG